MLNRYKPSKIFSRSSKNKEKQKPKLILTFSNGYEKKVKEFKKSNPFSFVMFMQKLPQNYKLTEVEGEGKLADFFREQLRLSKEQGEKYSPDYNKLIHVFLGRK